MDLENQLQERKEKALADAHKVLRAAVVAAAAGDGKVPPDRVDEIAKALDVAGMVPGEFGPLVEQYRRYLAMKKTIAGHPARLEKIAKDEARIPVLRQEIEELQKELRHFQAYNPLMYKAIADEGRYLAQEVARLPWLFADPEKATRQGGRSVPMLAVM